MGSVTAVMMDVITEKSGHSLTPMAVSVCLTPAAPAPLPIPYPVMGSSSQGIGDGPMRTMIEGATIATVGSVVTQCTGNQAGTLMEVVSLNVGGPCFPIMGAPVVLIELGMAGITGSPCIMNKAITVGAPSNASDADGDASGGGGGSAGDAPGGSATAPGSPSGGGGSGSDGTNTGATGPGTSSSPADSDTCQDGHPVDVVSGCVVDQAVDVSLPGPVPLVWKRYYSSARRDDKAATLGPGWAHGFEQRITEEARSLALRDGEGRSIYFEKVAPGASTFHRRERLTLRRGADGAYAVESLDTRLTSTFQASAEGQPARLRAIRDPYGNALTLDYDGERLARIVDTAGREVRVTWKASRIARLEVRAEGRLEQWVDYGYSAAGTLIAAVDALGHADQMEYDRHNRMVATVIKTGVRFQYEYEADTGRSLKTWGPKGLYAIELSKGDEARTTRVDGEEPRIYTWNDLGLMTREALPTGELIQERAFDEDGRLVAEVNGAGEGTQRWYDARGNLVRAVDAASNATTWEFDHDRPTRRVDPDGLEERFAHDDKGALTGVVDRAGRRYAFGRDEKGHVTAVFGPLGQMWALEYDAQHNLVAETDARGARTTYAYDGMGRPVTQTDALGRTTRVTYDRLGRRLALRLPDGTSRQFAYDALGNLVRETDGLGQVTAFERGGMGKLTRLIRPDGRAWALAYTSKERLKEIASPTGDKHAFTYDQAGRVVLEETFDGRRLAYRYDDAGRLARVDYPDKTFRAFAYDRTGQLVAEEAPDARLSFRRDRVGRLVEATIDEDGGRFVTQFERDALGRVISETQGDRRVRFAYDAAGRGVSRAMPDGTMTRYAYDAMGALTGVEHAGHRMGFERDVVGREVRRGDEAGRVSIRSVYDAMDRLVEQRALVPSPGDGVPGVLVQRQFRYDQLGRVKRIDDARWGATSYRYDRAGQLLDAIRGTHHEAFAYDAAGSLIQALERLEGASAPGDAAAAWESAPGGRLTRTANAKYTYDKRGRRIVKLGLTKGEAKGGADPGEAKSVPDAITEYRWDGRDRLREVRLPDGGRVAFTYDALGRRIRKEVFSGEPGARARVIDFVWDGDALAAEIDSERGARTFVHRPGTLVPLLQSERGEVFTYVTDHLGTAKELIDQAGMLAWSAAHGAWGAITETTANPAAEANRGRKVTSPFRLLGQVADEETGLCATKFRYFDPEVGRWCSPDPIGLAGGMNLTGFDGCPTVDVDPLGLAGNPHQPPPNMSPPGAGRQGAFNEAKRQNDIPTSQQPASTGPNIDRRGNVQPGRQYAFTDTSGNQVVIRDDAGGHDFGQGDPQNRGPHFNDPAGNHYDY